MNKTSAIAVFVAPMFFVACTATTENIHPSSESQPIPTSMNSQKESAQATSITEKKDITEPQEINAEIAGKYAIYAMMASNSYHQSKRVKFPIEQAGWIQVDLQGNETTKPTKTYPVSGLAYDIFKKKGTNEVVFAFRGTDSKWDYIVGNGSIIVSPQYKKANKVLRNYLEKHPSQKITVTGHSLGGGLALGASVHYGIDAITFDPSPRIFDGLGDKHLPAKRIAIYEEGEVLEKLRENWKKFGEVVDKENIYKCSFDFGKVSKHRGDYLAQGLLDLGATVNEDLVPIRDAVSNKK